MIVRLRLSVVRRSRALFDGEWLGAKRASEVLAAAPAWTLTVGWPRGRRPAVRVDRDPRPGELLGEGRAGGRVAVCRTCSGNGKVLVPLEDPRREPARRARARRQSRGRAARPVEWGGPEPPPDPVEGDTWRPIPAEGLPSAGEVLTYDGTAWR